MFLRLFLRSRILLIASLALLWWLLRRPPSEEAQSDVQPEIIVPSDTGDKPKPADPLAASEKAGIKEAIPTENAPPTTELQAAESAQPDDLTRIEGIGPKISSVLQEAGVNTYTQLADMDVDQIQAILHGANLRFARPATWPEQAATAAAGDWTALTELQSRLKGGVRS